MVAAHDNLVNVVLTWPPLFATAAAMYDHSTRIQRAPPISCSLRPSSFAD
jgi:hypothetical protein